MHYLVNFILKYWLLFILLILVILRNFLYDFPSPKEKNVQIDFLVTNSVRIEKAQKILKNSNYTIKTYNLDYCIDKVCSRGIEIGDVLHIRGDRYYSTIYAESVEYKKEHILKPLYRLKSSLINSSSSLLLEPYSSLLNGILFGVEPDFSPEYKDTLISAGVIHVIVVSGYNISVLYLLTNKLLSRYSIKLRSIVGFIIALIYCAIVGFEPPVIRALIMGTIVGYGSSTGNIKNTLYILILTLFAMVILDPKLLFSVSLQLTFLSTLGILLMSTPLENLIKGINFVPTSLKKDFTTSLSAQVFVLPVVIYFFNRVSLLGILINPLILWLIPIIMFLGIIFVSFYSLGFTFVYAIKFVLESPLILFGDVVQTMSTFQNINLELSNNIFTLIASIAFVVVIYLMVIYLNTKFDNKNG